MTITIFFSFLLFSGFSQNFEPNQFRMDSTGFNNFIHDFREYYERSKDHKGNFPTESYYFNTLTSSFDSLELLGYKLKYIHAEHDISDDYYARVNNDSTRINTAEILCLLENINTLCATGVYYGGFIGNKYYIFHSSKPTGMIREVHYYFMKED